jgi:hypothetical protein
MVKLKRVIECQLSDDPTFGVFRGKLCLLVHITPCKTDGKDATQELTFYRTETAPIITDLATIRAVIGRVQTTGGPSTQQHWSLREHHKSISRVPYSFFRLTCHLGIKFLAQFRSCRAL